MFNASAQYDLTDHVRLSMTVNNLFDEGLSRAGGEGRPARRLRFWNSYRKAFAQT
jgi:outer membrane receptor protein involved in Fe transport